MPYCLHGKRRIRFQLRLYHLNPETAPLATRARHNLDCDARHCNIDERTLDSYFTMFRYHIVDGVVWMVSSCAISSTGNTVHLWTIVQRSGTAKETPAFRLFSYPFFHLPACLSVSIHLIYPSIHPIQSMHPSIRLSVSACLSVYPSIHPSIYLTQDGTVGT